MIFQIIAIMAGLLGTFANVLKKRICFLFWMPASLFWFIYKMAENEIMMSVVFGIYFLSSLIGWFSWKSN